MTLSRSYMCGGNTVHVYFVCALHSYPHCSPMGHWEGTGSKGLSTSSARALLLSDLPLRTFFLSQRLKVTQKITSWGMAKAAVGSAGTSAHGRRGSHLFGVAVLAPHVLLDEAPCVSPVFNCTRVNNSKSHLMLIELHPYELLSLQRRQTAANPALHSLAGSREQKQKEADANPQLMLLLSKQTGGVFPGQCFQGCTEIAARCPKRAKDVSKVSCGCAPQKGARLAKAGTV